MVAVHAQPEGRTLLLQSVARQVEGGVVSVRLESEAFSFEQVTDLRGFVRSLVREAGAAREALWMRRARAGWVFCQLLGVGPYATIADLAADFGMHKSKLRSWMRLAQRVVHEPSGSIDSELVRKRLAERDRLRSERAVTARQRKAAEKLGRRTLEDRTQAEVEEAVGLRTPRTHVRGVDGWGIGEQLGMERLYAVAGGFRRAVADADDERVAGWIRQGRIDVGVLRELGLVDDESNGTLGDTARAGSR